MEGGSGLVHLAITAALAGHFHLIEVFLAALFVFALAVSAASVQPIGRGLSAIEARCCQGALAHAARLLLRHLALPAAVFTVGPCRACVTEAFPATPPLGA